MVFINVKKCLTDPKQLIKLVVLIICLCVTCYQLSGCVRKILNPPLSTHFRVELNGTLKHPTVTLCRKPAYKFREFHKFGIRDDITDITVTVLYDVFQYDKYSIDEFIYNTTYSLDEMIYWIAFNGQLYHPSDGTGLVNISSQYYLKHGRCFTFTPLHDSDDFTMNGGHYFYMKHDGLGVGSAPPEYMTVGFEIFVHDEHQVLTDVDGQADSFTESFFVPAFTENYADFTIAKFQKVSKKEKPCVDEPHYSRPRCQEQCAHRIIAEELQCTTPWVKHLDRPYPLCNNSEKMKLLVEWLAFIKDDWKASCQCLESCNVNLYTINVERHIREANRRTTELKLFASSNAVTMAEEVLTYDLNVFISDVGGSMGFLLGLSVIGILAAAEQLLRSVFAKKSSELLLQKDNVSEVEDKIFVDEHERRRRRIAEYFAQTDLYERMRNKQQAGQEEKY